MIADGRFTGEPLITSQIGLDEIVTSGFESLIKHKDDHFKILVSPR